MNTELTFIDLSDVYGQGDTNEKSVNIFNSTLRWTEKYKKQYATDSYVMEAVKPYKNGVLCRKVRRFYLAK